MLWRHLKTEVKLCIVERAFKGTSNLTGITVDGDRAGIHIPSHPVVPCDYNLVWTIKITSKVALWKSEVLFNHKIFSKILVCIFMHFPCVLSTALVHLKLLE